jgi:site-specific DNA-methyltransferase (adenine-specific)
VVKEVRSTEYGVRGADPELPAVAGLEPFACGRGWAIYCADVLDLVPRLPAGCVDAVITDPPYTVAHKSQGGRTKASEFFDLLNFGHWLALWYGESRRVLRPSGYLSACSNWRTLPAVLFAFDRIGWAAAGCLVWDKQWIGPAGPHQFRPVWEVVPYAAMPDAAIADRSAADLFRHKWMARHAKGTSHPAAKPVELMAYLVEHLGGPVVADWFCGECPTGVAAIRAGRRFIGADIDPHWCEIAANRLRAAEAEQEPAA